MRKHCIAIGGGGWMMGENPSPLDQYILSLSGKENPNICFLPTATGDADEVIERFYNAKLSENLTHFPLFKFDAGWKETLFEQDIIYVGGGNTRSMLAIWREWGIDRILKQCYEQGIIICGMSAGAICWFEFAVTDSDPEAYQVMRCLGLIDGLAAAHFSHVGEKFEVFQAFARSQPSITCYGIHDYAALHFVDGKLLATVTSFPDAGVLVKTGNEENILRG
ncbi:MULTISPECIES: Type 1 glutamine amidotransferase-like domain-containing protein [Vibrio]|uniref:Type 1 glutamine amidotransferase-like domain-containing protein n=1 Tax=Vibrio TaxID=662 RepID=UPI00031FDB15|nr:MULTISPECIES: peptidase E [Vibrio]EGQ8008612.1 peptidase E [Vibrio parahaemolyticus]EGQ8011656.1 peptidase E [Vibrio parahaemolyticus]EGQ9520695.1 peptidase E [Vibrio parahaemolyticus]EGR2780749.1 peptidase E [Vibrio parahaemolyticus]EHH1043152.1 peptidase E [Vibrio parahaemolyticus]